MLNQVEAYCMKPSETIAESAPYRELGVQL